MHSKSILTAKIRLQRTNGFCLQVDLKLAKPAILAICGISGSGKTTLLRVLAGLEKSADARISMLDKVWQSPCQFVPPHKRRYRICLATTEFIRAPVCSAKHYL